LCALVPLLGIPNLLQAASNPIKLKFASYGQQSQGMNSYGPEFKRLVEERSQGRLLIDYYPDGQLVANIQACEALMAGTVDISLTSLGHWSGYIPEVKFFNSVGAALDFEQFSSACDMPGGFKDILEPKFNKLGVKGLAIGDHGGSGLIFKKIVRVPADMKGIKTRCFDEEGANFIKACGAIPAVIPFTEVYMALQMGTIDGYLGGVPGIRAGKMYEIVKYLVVPAGLTGHATTSYQMNLKVFNALPKDLQDILIQSQRDAEKVYRAAQKKDYFASFDELKEVGVVIEKAAMDVNTPEWRQWYEATKHLGEKLKEEIGSQLFDITLKVRGGK